MATRHVELSAEADPILDSIADSYGGDPGAALSELLIAHESIESFLDEIESQNAAELIRQRDTASLEFGERRGIPWEQIKLENKL